MSLLQGEELALFAREVEARIELILDRTGEATIHERIVCDVLRARIVGVPTVQRYAQALALFMRQHRLVASLDYPHRQFTFKRDPTQRQAAAPIGGNEKWKPTT